VTRGPAGSDEADDAPTNTAFGCGTVRLRAGGVPEGCRVPSATGKERVWKTVAYIRHLEREADDAARAGVPSLHAAPRRDLRGIIAYYFNRTRHDRVEAPKYRMLDDDEPLPDSTGGRREG